MHSVPSALADGLLPRYRLGSVLAEGGQAVVVQARDLSLDRDVAIKVLPRASASAVGVARFLREIRLLADLPHPYIIPILDAGEAAGVLWYAMPLVRGESLAVRCAAGPVPVETVRQWGRELGEALDVAHSHGVVHRDVKPANVQIVDGHALLADFGVAALLETTDTLTGPEQAVGTSRYMAPEQRAGGGDHRVDLFGMGATLYEASTGSRWVADAPEWHRVPRTLRGALRRALAHRPESRWPTAVDFAAALSPSWTTGWRPAAAAMVGLVTLLAVGATLRGPPPTVGPFRTDLAVVAMAEDPLTQRLLRASVVRLEWFPPLHVAPWEGGDVEITPTWRAEGMVEWSRGQPMATITLRDQAGRAIEVLHVAGDTADLPAWGQAVAAAIVGRVRPDHLHDFEAHSGGARIGGALRAYYAGRSAFDRQDWEAAEAGYREALAVDPAFAQARWGVVQARKWARRPFAEDLALLAETGDLPAPLGTLVALQLQPDLELRFRGLDSLAAEWPDVPDVHLVRANEIFHRGALVGRRDGEGVAALSAAARRFPSLDRPVVWDHVVWGAVRLGDEATARDALRARRRGLVGDDPWGPLLRFTVESRFRPWLGAALGATLRTFGREVRPRVADAHRLAVMFDLPDAQGRFAEWLRAGGADTPLHTTAWSGLAVAALMQGRAAAALAAIDSATQASGSDPELVTQQLEWRLLLPLLGTAVDAETYAGARAALSGDRPASWSVGRWLFLRGVAGGMAGDTTVLLAALDTLRAIDGDPLAQAVLRSWHVADGKEASAVEALRRAVTIDAADGVVRARGPFVRALAVVRLGELQLALGDTVAAERELRAHGHVDLRGWPTGPPQEGEVDAAVSTASRWRRGTLLLAMGDTTAGCPLRRRAAELWDGAEATPRLLLDGASTPDGDATCRR